MAAQARESLKGREQMAVSGYRGPSTPPAGAGSAQDDILQIDVNQGPFARSEERTAAGEDRIAKGNARPKKKLVRRTDRDYSQQLRLGFQLAFLALNVWIGVQFYQWVRWAETAGRTRAVDRPAGVEGWLPIAGLMQLKYVIVAHQWPTIHPAGLFLLAAFLLMSFLLRKAFCSWLCPVGTLSEYLWKLGRSTFRRNFSLPRWLDVVLRGTKYVLLAFFGLCGSDDACNGNRRLSQRSLRSDRRRSHAELFPFPGRNCGVCFAWAHRRVDLRAELLVPLSLPVWSADGSGFDAEPGEDPAQRARLHRLRQVCQGLPCGAAGR